MFHVRLLCLYIYLVESPRGLWTCVGALPEQMRRLHPKTYKTETFKGMPQRLEVHGESHRKGKPFSGWVRGFICAFQVAEQCFSDPSLQKPQPDLTIMYRNMQMELSRICGRLQTLEQSQRNNNTYDSLSKKSQEEYFAIKNAQIDLKRAIEKLQYQSQIVFEWKRHVDAVLDGFKQQCKLFEKIKEDSDKQLFANKSGQNIFDSIITDVNQLQQQFNEDRINNRELQNDLKTKIEEFKDFYIQENATIAALWNDQKNQVDATLQNIEKLTTVLEEQKLKFNAIIFDLRSVSQTASESAQKVEILERDFAEIRTDLAQIRLDQEISGLTPESGGENHNCGRLLWKITDFAVKMKDAKENGVVLKSPAFYTHEYGYKIRVRVITN